MEFRQGRLGVFGFRLVFLASVLFPSSPVLAVEGMWLYSHLPVVYLRDRYGIEMTPELANHLMQVSVRFDSGSGSFVSPDGLVLTNHHVGAHTLHALSSGPYDYLTHGFLAKTRADEVRAPDLELKRLERITDVTDRVLGAIRPGMDLKQANEARAAAIGQIAKEATDRSGLFCEVVPLFQGGRYSLHEYKVFKDVRLVFAPETKAAMFGGDPDNFEFPRYNLDMCLFRVYENGVPARIQHFLHWSSEGVNEGDAILVSGHPGNTSRALTVAGAEERRDFLAPLGLAELVRQEELLQAYSERGEAEAHRARGELFIVENRRKVRTAWQRVLNDPAFMARKRAAEAELRSAVQADPDLKAAATAWQEIAAAELFAREINERFAMLSQGKAFDSKFFWIARLLVQRAEELKKPNSERLPEFQEAALAESDRTILSHAEIYLDFESFKLAESLAQFRYQLSGDPIVETILKGQAPAELAHQLVYGTKLVSLENRRALLEGGAKAVADSDDPWIRLMRLIDGEARALRLTMQERYFEVTRQAYAKLARARFKLKGDSIYPDATFTLRLAFGEVRGYSDRGQTIPFTTTIGGAFEHETRHGAKAPWILPASWHARRGELDPAVQFNFVSTADIIGGNSGSPTISSCGKKLVGLIFDGNRPSLSAEFEYNAENGRAVSVSAAGMLHALERIYGADALVREIKGL